MLKQYSAGSTWKKYIAKSLVMSILNPTQCSGWQVCIQSWPFSFRSFLRLAEDGRAAGARRGINWAASVSREQERSAGAVWRLATSTVRLVLLKMEVLVISPRRHNDVTQNRLKLLDSLQTQTNVGKIRWDTWQIKVRKLVLTTDT